VPSSVWLDAWGLGFPAPNFPRFETLGTLFAIQITGDDYAWCILTEEIIEKECALSGSVQSPAITGTSIRQVLGSVRSGAPGPVQRFLAYGEDFVVADNIDNLVIGMNRLTGEKLLDAREVERQIQARDREMDNTFTKDLQIAAMRTARNYLG